MIPFFVCIVAASVAAWIAFFTAEWLAGRKGKP